MSIQMVPDDKLFLFVLVFRCFLNVFHLCIVFATSFYFFETLCLLLLNRIGAHAWSKKKTPKGCHIEPCNVI
jgi:hypothetical protein